MNATTGATIEPAGESKSAATTPYARRKAEIAGASMAELVTFGRMFWVAINCRRSPDDPYDDELEEEHEAETGALANFDGEITAMICERAPKDAADYGIKSAYLFQRLRAEDIAPGVEEQALAALERDARAMAGLPVLPATD